jgi:hypothetical protein
MNFMLKSYTNENLQRRNSPLYQIQSVRSRRGSNKHAELHTTPLVICLSSGVMLPQIALSSMQLQDRRLKTLGREHPVQCPASRDSRCTASEADFVHFVLELGVDPMPTLEPAQGSVKGTDLYQDGSSSCLTGLISLWPLAAGTWGFLLGLILWHRYHGMDEDLIPREGLLGSGSLVWEVCALCLLRVLGGVVVRERRRRRRRRR